MVFCPEGEAAAKRGPHIGLRRRTGSRGRPRREPHPAIAQRNLTPLSIRDASQGPNLSAARAFAFAASSSRFLLGAVVSSERRRRVETSATSSIAARNEASFAFDGLLKPLIFRTYCSEAARISSSVTGGSKLKRVLIFLHIHQTSSSHAPKRPERRQCTSATLFYLVTFLSIDSVVRCY